MALTHKTIVVPTWRLDELDSIIDAFEGRVADTVHRQSIKDQDDYLLLVLRTSGKALVTMREILTLAVAGFPDGALSLARNLYEQFITLYFLNQKHALDAGEFDAYISAYYASGELQRLHALEYEATYCTENKKKAERLNQEKKQLKDLHPKIKNGVYGWTGCGNFGRLCKYGSEQEESDTRRWLSLLHLAYKRSCVSLHANALGNRIRLGDDWDFSGIDTSAHIKGHGLPLWLATCSFILIAGITCEELEIDFEPFKEKLNELAVFYQSHQKDDS